MASDSATERSPPGSEGRFSSLPSKAIVVEPPASSAEAAAPAVDREQDDLAVGALADGGARVARRELRGQEVFAGGPDRFAVLHDHRPAAESVRDAGREPVGRENQ